MGGVGLSITDGLTTHFMNPAALAELPLSYISGNLFHEAVNQTSQTQTASLSNTNVGGVQFSIPLKTSRASLAIALRPFTTIEYRFSDVGIQGEKTFTEIIDGDGGVNVVTLSLGVKPFHRLYLGVSGLYYFGTIRNKWRVLFDSPNFRNTQDEVSRSFTAGNVRFGTIYKVSSKWSVGGVFSPSVTLDAKRAVELESGIRFTDFPNEALEIPSSFGVGTSIFLGKFLLGADYYSQRWSEVKKNGFVNDSYRLAFGFEYSARGRLGSSFFKRIAYRAGFYYQDLGLEYPAGEPVKEIFGTVGLGLPIKWAAGRLDFALEFGRRGSTPDNPFKETVIKFTGSVTAGEKWFFRGVKR